MRKSRYIILCLLLVAGCKSVQFGNSAEPLDFETIEAEHEAIEKIEIPYKAFINVFPVKGTVLHILGSVVAPDGRLFLVINFPHLGILASSDGGKTFSHSLFYSDYFASYDNENEDGNQPRRSVHHDISVHSAFANDGKIALSAGPFLFLSEDNGATWKKNTPFYNLDTSFIRKILCDGSGRLYLFTDDKAAYSDNWGKKWISSSFRLGSANPEKSQLKLKKFQLKLKNFQFIDAVLCDKGLLVSYINKHEKKSKLYEMSFNAFSGEKQDFTDSGVFSVSSDLKLAASLNLPPVIFISAQKGISPFDFALEDLQLEDNFKKTFFYKTGSLKEGKNSTTYFTRQLSKMESGKIFGQSSQQKAIDIATGEIVPLTQAESAAAAKARQMNDSSFIIDGTGISKDDYRFSYNTAPLNQIRSFSGGYLRETQIVTMPDENGDYYRIRLRREFLSGLFNEIMKKKWKRDNLNAFFYKDERSYNFQIDKLYKRFPFILEKVASAGEATEIFTPEMLEFKISPRSRMNRWFWYKNIDKKRQFKLEVLVGTGDEPDMLCVPSNLERFNDGLLLEISYFYHNNCYRELFILNLPG